MSCHPGRGGAVAHSDKMRTKSASGGSNAGWNEPAPTGWARCRAEKAASRVVSVILMLLLSVFEGEAGRGLITRQEPDSAAAAWSACPSGDHPSPPLALGPIPSSHRPRLGLRCSSSSLSLGICTNHYSITLATPACCVLPPRPLLCALLYALVGLYGVSSSSENLRAARGGIAKIQHHT